MNKIFNTTLSLLILTILLTACSESCIGTYDASQELSYSYAYVEADGNYTNSNIGILTPPNFSGTPKYTPTFASTTSHYTFPYGQWYNTGVGVVSGDNFTITTSGGINDCTISFTDTITPNANNTTTITYYSNNITYSAYYSLSQQPIAGGEKIFLGITDSAVTSCGGNSYICFSSNSTGNTNPASISSVFTGGQSLVAAIADVSGNSYTFDTANMTVSADNTIINPNKYGGYILTVPSYVPTSGNTKYLLSYMIIVPTGGSYLSGSYTINGFIRPKNCEVYNGTNLNIVIMSSNPNSVCSGSSASCQGQFVNAGGELSTRSMGYSYSGTAGVSGTIWARYEDPTNYADNVDNYRMHIYKQHIPQSFSAFMNFIIDPIRASLEQAIISIWLAWVTNDAFISIITSMLTLYVVIYSIMFMFAMTEDNLRDFVGRLIRIGIIMTVISCNSWTFFNQYLFAFFFVQHETNVTAVCSKSIGGACTSTVLPSLSGGPPIVDTTQKSGVDVLISIVTGGTASNNANTFGFIDNVFAAVFNKYTFLRILGLLFSSFIGPVLSIFLIVMVYSYLIVFLDLTLTYIYSMIGVAFLISMGPLFIIAMLFSTTRNLFENWLKLLIYFGIVPVIYVATLYILNNIIMILLYTALNYDLCWNCVLEISIPSLGNLFCIYWWTLQTVNGASYSFITMVFAILVSILVAFIMIKLFWGIPDIITTVAKQALGMAQAPQIAGIIMKQASLGALVDKYKKKKQARDDKKQKNQGEKDNKERAQDTKDKDKDKDKDKSKGNSAGVSTGKGESNA